MEKQTALHIIQTLAQGIDPHSGAPLPADSPYQHADTVRALFQAVQALSESPASLPRSSARSSPVNAGKPWTADEDKTLAEHFDSGRSIAELAVEHGRTRAAMQARLMKLGKLDPTAEPPRFSKLAAIESAAGACGT